MHHRLLPCFAISIICGVSTFGACSYDPPDVIKPSSTGQGGTGGGNASSSSGQTSSNASSSSSGQGGAGGQGICVDSPQPECLPYAGAPGTDMVGTCRQGRSFCQLDNMWGVCDSDIIPVVESCSSVGDVNCDGVLPCKGSPIAVFSDSASQSPQDELILAVAAGNGLENGQDGPVFAVGTRAATLNPSPGNNFQVLAWRQEPDGQVTNWSNLFSFAPTLFDNGAAATSVIVLPNSGDVVISGIFYGGTLTINGDSQQAGTSKNSFLVRLSPTGEVVNTLFASAFGDLTIWGMTADSIDNIYVVGDYLGDGQIDSGQLPNSGLGVDGYVVSLSPSLGFQWQQVYSAAGRQSISAIARIDDDNIAIAATFVGQMVVTTGSGTKTLPGGPEPDIAVIKLRTTDGAALWDKQVVGKGVGATMEVGGLAANATTVAVAGRFTQTVNIGGVDHQNPEPSSFDAFVATLAAATGDITFQALNQAPETQDIRALAFDTAGDLILAGFYANSFPMPMATLSSAAGFDAFVIKAKPDLNGRWAHKLGSDTAYQGAYAVTIGKATGDLYVGGGFQGVMNINGTSLMSTGGLDAFLVRMGD